MSTILLSEHLIYIYLKDSMVLEKIKKEESWNEFSYVRDVDKKPVLFGEVQIVLGWTSARLVEKSE